MSPLDRPAPAPALGMAAEAAHHHDPASAAADAHGSRACSSSSRPRRRPRPAWDNGDDGADGRRVGGGRAVVMTTVVTATAAAAAAGAMLLVLLPSLAGAQPQMSGSSSYPSTGKVEGCYNEFDSLMQITYTGAQETLNNMRCRVRCASSGFSMSATSAQTCFCGNNYPSVFHRVPDSQCSKPCSPDRAVCEGAGCCGDRLGKYYTVSFAKEIDVTLQLLRTLTYDYRSQNKRFQQYIESKVASTAALQVATFDGVQTMAGTATNNAQPQSAVGFGNGCPAGWSLFKRACYKRVSGKLTDFSKAQSTCQSMGANLPTIQNAEENDYVKSLLNGQAGWLGLTGKAGGWDWDGYQGWGPGEPASTGPTRLSPLFGPGGGTPFNDYSADLAAIDTITIGYRAGTIDAIQVSYQRKDGTVYAAPSYGAFQRTSTTAAIPFNSGKQRIAKVEGAAAGTLLRSLTFTVTDLDGGNSRVYGPYGSSLGASVGGGSFSYTPGDVVVAIYGAATDTALTQLGFVEANIPRCAAVDDAGNWRAVDCDMKQDGVTYLCERRPTISRIDCPDGWVAYGSSCYQGQAANAVSWNEANQRCVQLGGSLANVDSTGTQEQVKGLMGGKGFLGIKDLSTTPSATRRWGWKGFQAWGNNQPVPGAACSVMEPSGLWASTDCGAQQAGRATLCEADPLDTLCTCPQGWRAFQCSCYYLVQAAPGSIGQTWSGAAAACDAQKARLADVGSREETNFVLGLTKGQGIFLGLRDAGGAGGKMATGYFRRWAGSTAPNPVGAAGDAQCATMRPDGSWGSSACTAQMGTYVCQMRLTAPEATIKDVSNGEQFRFTPVNPAQPVQWGVPVPVRIQHAASGAYLAMDLNGRVYQTFNATKDALFELATVPATNAFLIQSLAYENMYLNFDEQTGGLRGGLANVNVTDYRPESSIGGTDYMSLAEAAAVKRRRQRQRQRQLEQEQAKEGEGQGQEEEERGLQAANPQNGGTQGYQGTGGGGNYALNGGIPTPAAPSASLAPGVKYRDLPATAFMASQLVSPLAIQNLQISVAVFRSDTMENPRLCTMFIYDLTPNSDSYTCYEVQGDPTGLPLVEMEMAAWITQDKTSVLGPRSPLENGRTRCENSAPSETVTCNVAYGEGLTFQRELDVIFGQYYAYFFQFNEGSAAGADTAWGGYYNFQAAYTNTYTTQIIRSYIETRNWAVVVPVAPQSVATVQYWISTVDIRYLWMAVLNAQGSFDVASMGLYLSTGQSLTALSYLEDLFFYTFGTFSYPSQAEIIITVDDVEANKFPFVVPNFSNVGGGV